MKNEVIPQAEVATATVNQVQTTTANPKSTKIENGKKRKKKRTVPTLWKCQAEALKVFSYQLTKDNEVKLQCVQKAFENVPDVEKLWGQFMGEVNRLLDSRKYCAECAVVGVSAENLAEHIVLLGRATVNQVLDNGIIATIGTDYLLYKDRFTRPEDVDIYLPTYYDGERKCIELNKTASAENAKIAN